MVIRMLLEEHSHQRSHLVVIPVRYSSSLPDKTHPWCNSGVTLIEEPMAFWLDLRLDPQATVCIDTVNTGKAYGWGGHRPQGGIFCCCFAPWYPKCAIPIG